MSFTYMNILVLLFLLLMVYWWAVSGFFNGLLHLLTLIVAGAIAFAVWELMVVNVLIHRMPFYAWGVWLITAFVLLVIGLRAAVDSVITKNVMLEDKVNLLGGAACGFLGGQIAAGIGVIGMGLMVLPPDFMGYKPYQIDPQTGYVIQGENGLWPVQVEKNAYGFFAMLSRGSFARWTSEASLALYRPELPRLAGSVRLRGDAYASIVAVPESVKVEQVATALASSAFSDDELNRIKEGTSVSRNKIVVVDSRWFQKAGTYDGDNTLRLYPTQVRLVTWFTQAGRTAAEVHQPAGFVTFNRDTGNRIYRPVNLQLRSVNDKNPLFFVHDSTKEVQFSFVFVVPERHEPQFLIARLLRLSLQDPGVRFLEGDAEAVRNAVGTLPLSFGNFDEEPQQEARPRDDGRLGDVIGARTGLRGESIEVSSELPRSFNPRNASGLSYDQSDQGRCVLSGEASVSTNGSGGGVSHVCGSDADRKLVRISLAGDRANTLMGNSRDLAAATGMPFLVDDQRQNHPAIGYAVLEPDGTQRMFFEPMGLRAASQLPRIDNNSRHRLFLYFTVPSGRRITSYEIGRTTQRVEGGLRVP